MRSRRSNVVYIQITAAVVSLLLGIFNLGKESRPFVQGMVQRVRERTDKKEFEWVYKGQDSHFRYWSDPTGRYWCRMDPAGMVQYAEHPQYVANNPSTIR
jgi:hypothetical protein